MLAVNVVPTVETVADSGGEDDAAIWIHPTNPALSTVIGTVKTSSNSLRVYNLQGQQIQSVAVSQVNNVDLRYNFSLGGQSVAIVTGSNRSNNSISIYKVDSQTGMLSNVAARTITTGMAIYGCAMYVSPTTGKFYTFVSSESGQVQQWELFDNGAGKVDAVQVRSFNVGSQVEGLVADDVLGNLFVGEENVGIWKYSAEPTSGTSRSSVDTTSGHLSADVEGLSIYYAANGGGYLIASSQGSNEFVIYNRSPGHAFIGSFKLVAGNGIDAVADTDGIDVTNFGLGSQFPQGVFIAQDSDDNFKLARWDAIDTALSGVLAVDTTWDPRLIGKPPASASGDFNRDNRVDGADYVLWRNSLGAAGLTPFSGADGNGDGKVDAADRAIWRSHFDTTLSPATLALAVETQALPTVAEVAVANPGEYMLVAPTSSDRGTLSSSDIIERRAFVKCRDAVLEAWVASRAGINLTHEGRHDARSIYHEAVDATEPEDSVASFSRRFGREFIRDAGRGICAAVGPSGD